ncbi:MAG: SDR family NAD(P)-dependent oxidoreductase, partial [Bacteroidales bacterium]
MEGKVVIITGSSSGIGRALAIEFAKRKARLVLAARSLDELDRLKGGFPEVDILTVQTDVSKEEDCHQLIRNTIKKYG